ncbi:hypothetical protein LCGC14_0244080 [marine sediment metagenome]|uniref:Uncharacterized protein n=1 Tax=marine sediment metagenome TaxID=412755 RepID=A0A0F9WRF3_9ZZZZ
MAIWKTCEVKGCKAEAIPNRIICYGHAYPAELKKSGRRQAIEAQKKAKAMRLAAEEETTPVT